MKQMVRGFLVLGVFGLLAMAALRQSPQSCGSAVSCPSCSASAVSEPVPAMASAPTPTLAPPPRTLAIDEVRQSPRGQVITVTVVAEEMTTGSRPAN